MFDSTIHTGTIARQLRKADFHSRLWSLEPEGRDDVIVEAERIAREGFDGVAFKISVLGAKNVYRQASLPEALLTRHVSESIKRLTGVKQANRQSIIRSLIALASEGAPFSILKMDVKSFYETVDPQLVLSALREDAAFSRQSLAVLESYFAALRKQDIAGLPRGVGLSATLAEYVMRRFDAAIAHSNGVRFYSRYVDDAVAVVSNQHSVGDLLEHAKRSLPAGLTFNRAKTRSYQFKPNSGSTTGALEHSINFLGYCLSIHEAVSRERVVSRSVIVDISDRKVSLIKRRVARSLLEFNNGGSYRDLLDRLRLLTSNVGFVDESSGQQRFSGLRYNYGLIDPTNSMALEGLDRFLVNALTSKHRCNRIKPALSFHARRKLLGLGFQSGFVDNRFFSFSGERIRQLARCWSHA